MRASSLITVALSSSVASCLEFTNRNFTNITVGTPFNITWVDASGSTSLNLLKGGTQDYLDPVATIASNVSGSNYIWVPDPSLTRDVYTIHFLDASGNSAYGFLFELLAPASEATPGISAAAAATTTYTATWTYP